jgi:hypothetical protein
MGIALTDSIPASLELSRNGVYGIAHSPAAETSSLQAPLGISRNGIALTSSTPGGAPLGSSSAGVYGIALSPLRAAECSKKAMEHH